MNQNVYIGLAILVVAIAIWWFYIRKTPVKKAGAPAAPVVAESSSSGKPTIYGSLGCPYTIKQMEKYPDHTFVDCSVPGACPAFVTAYPTTKWPDGKVDVGFS